MIIRKTFLIYICLAQFDSLMAVESKEKIETLAPSIPNIKLTCPEESWSSRQFGTFVFPETEAEEHGKVVKIDCPYGFRDDGQESIYGEVTTKDSKINMSGMTRFCILITENGETRAEWRQPNDQPQYCKYKGTANALHNFMSALETVNPNEPNIRQSVWNFARIVADHAINYADHECALTLVNGFASLLTLPRMAVMDEKDRDYIYTALEGFIKSLSSSLPPGVKVQVGNAGIAIETAVFPGLDYFARAKPLTDAEENANHGITITGVKHYETRLAPGSEISVFIDISAEAVNQALDQEQSMKGPQLRITAYSDEVLKTWNGTDGKLVTPSQICTPMSTMNTQEETSAETQKTSSTNECDDGENSTCIDHTMHNSRGLLCIELNGNIKNLSEPVEFLIMDNFKPPDGYEIKCVFWDPEGNWSTEGVMTTHQENGIKCTSTHLSAFSALIEPLPLPFPGAEYAPINNSIHSYILSILSSIGSVFSIIGLFLTLLTYGIFRSLRRERSNRILINLSLSLLLLHIMSVSGSKSFWDDHCFIPAVSLHYFVLTSLAWMMVEAVHMFELLISVFVRPETRFLVKRILLAWGMPLIIVVVCAIVQPQVYYLGRADLCLMSPYENIFLYYGAYIGPVCLMLLVNLIIFIRIFRVFYQQTKRTKAVNQGHGGNVPKYYLVKISPSQIKGATSVLVLLGIGWILGLLAMGPFEVLFRYMYCICNAGQGLLIFIFRVVLNPQACKQWRKLIIGFPSSEGSIDLSTSGSSTSAPSGKRQLKRKSTIMMTPTFSSTSNSVENSLTASNPLSATLATTLAAILRAENEKAVTQNQDIN